MRKIVLVEDRPERQRKFTEDLTIDLNKFPALENICGGKTFGDFKSSLADISQIGAVIKEKGYDVIMIHRSALEQSERIALIEIAKRDSKTIVFFSGGISSVSLQEIGNKGYLLTINSKDFYSESLKNYLESPEHNIFELAFGKKWKINFEIELLEKLNFYSKEKSESPFAAISLELNLKEWLIDNYFSDYKNKRITREDLEQIKEKILTNLNKTI